jgi:hypothetical protein
MIHFLADAQPFFYFILSKESTQRVDSQSVFRFSQRFVQEKGLRQFMSIFYFFLTK